MTQDISTTITVALAKTGVAASALNLYSDQINAVQDALVEREYQITDALLDVAERFGHYSREEVEAELGRNIPGLAFRPAAPEPEESVADAFASYLKDAEAVASTVNDEGHPEADEEEVAPEDESKAGKKARKEQERRELIERLTLLEQRVNSLAILARRHLDASI